MRKTVQEWMDANNHSTGPAKKKIASLKRLKRIPTKATTAVHELPSIKRRTKKKRDSAKGRRPK